MSSEIDLETVLNYLRTNDVDGQTFTLHDVTKLLPAIAGVLTEKAMPNLAYYLNDGQREWLVRLAEAATRTNDQAIAMRLSEEEYHTQKNPRFGASNPTLTNLPFWQLMVQRQWDAWGARSRFDRAHRAYIAESPPLTVDQLQTMSKEEMSAQSATRPRYKYGEPVWSFQRYGISATKRYDGRDIWIAGTHEALYDPDFYIYNDVIVIHPDLSIDIYCYPHAVFPPTDFHTATEVANSIYIIGCLGYHGTRQPGETPVYRLDCITFQIEKITTTGEKPGWISQHSAEYLAEQNSIQVTGGEIFLRWHGKQRTKVNRKTYQLDLATGQWSVSKKSV
jgi:hypothetical protein